MDYSWLEVGDFVLIQSGTQRAAGQILRLSEEQIIIKQADGFKAMFRLDQVSSIVQVDGEKLAALNEVSAPAPTPASAFIPAPAVDAANTFAAHYAAALAKIESMPLPPKISEESFLEYDGIKRNYPQFYASYQSACTSVFYAKKNDRSSLDDKVKPAVAQFKTMYQETHEPYLLQLIAYLHFLRTDVGDGFTYAMHQLGEYRNSQASFDFYVSNGRLPGAISLWREFIGAPHVMLHAIQQPYPHSLVKGQQMSACLTDMMQSPLADRNAVHLIIYALYKRLVPAETAYSFDDYAISDTEAVNRMYESLITVLNTGTGIATVLGEIPNTRNYEVITLTNTLAVLEHAPYALSPGDIIHFSANGVPGHYSFVQINRREDVKRSNLKKVQKALVKDHAPQNLIAKVNRLIANVQPTPKPRGNTNNHSAITKAIQSARTMEECEQVTRKIVNLLEGSTCSESEKKAHVKDLISIRLRKTILDYDGAIAYAEKYRTQFDFSKDEQLQIDRLLVPAYIGKQEYRKAISLLETLTRDQFVLQDLIKLARCHLQLKEYRICIEHCRRVLFYEKKGIPDIGAAYTCMFAAYIGMGEEHYDDAERTLADYQVVCSNLQKIEHMRTMLENAKAGVTAEPQIENLVDAATGDQVYTTPYLDYILKSTGYMRLSPAEFDTAIGKFVWEPSGVEEAEKFYTRLSETTVFKNNRLNEGDFGMVWETKMDMIRIASYCLTSFKEEEEAFYAEWAKRYLESAGHFMWLSYKKKILELNPLVGTCAFFALECLQMYSQLPATEFLKFPEFYDALNMYIVYSMGFKKGTFHAVQVKKKNVFKEADIAAAWDAIESNFSKMFQNEKLYAGAVKVLVRLLYYCRPLMPIIMKIIKKIGKEYVVRTQIMGVVERSYENAESLDQLFEKYFSEFRRNKNRFDTIMEEIRTCAEEEDRSAAGIRKSLETLLHFLENTNGLLWSPLDIERCRSLANILAKYCDLHNLNNYELKQENYRTIKMDSDANEKDFATNPSELSFGILQSILAIIRKAVTEESNALTQESLPVISIQNEYEEEGYWPKSNQSIDVMLLIYNGKGGEQCTPASNFFIDIAVGEDAQRFCNLSQTHFAEDFTLRGGESASVPIPLPLTHEGVTNEKPFVMTVSVSYKNVNGETTSITQEMNIRVKSRDEYKVIPNPYSPGPLRPGTENAKLFQGRDEAVDDLCNRILSGNNGGKTVLIYGQFRSGKSTLMNFLADKLKRESDEILIVEANSVIEGEYSGDEGWDIVNKIIEAICDTLIDKYDDLPEALEPYENPCATEETYVRYFERFTRTLKRCMDKEEIPKTHLVVKMDEFGRFFEKRDTSIFMQLWKSVMEMEAFDAILAGHDVITQMIRKYVNPFGTINLFQISYINRAAAVSLITQPTYREDKGSSSFTDEAVDYIWKQSGGNVFYIHVICGYAVKFMNNYHINILNTKYVQQAIAEQLDHIDVCALEELGHALYKSGECGEDRVTDTEAKIVLHAITVCQNTHDCSTAEALMAYVADAYNLYIPNNERVMSILESLFSRGVIEKDDKGNYMIRVNFYPSYLDKHIIASLEKIQ